MPFPFHWKATRDACYLLSSFGIPCEHTVWCYDFDWVKTAYYGVACHMTGCERGLLYSWWEFCLFPSDSPAFNVRMCFWDYMRPERVANEYGYCPFPGP